jgi:hypothetical protein
MVPIWQISTNERQCHSINVVEDIDFTVITIKILNLKSYNPHEMFEISMAFLVKRDVDPISI